MVNMKYSVIGTLALASQALSATVQTGGCTLTTTQGAQANLINFALSCPNSGYGALAMVQFHGGANGIGFHCNYGAGTVLRSTSTPGRSAHNSVALGNWQQVSVQGTTCTVAIPTAEVPAGNILTSLASGGGGVTAGNPMNYNRHGGRGAQNANLQQVEGGGGGAGTQAPVANGGGGAEETQAPVANGGGGQQTPSPVANGATGNGVSGEDDPLGLGLSTPILVGIGAAGLVAIGGGYMALKRKSGGGPPPIAAKPMGLSPMGGPPPLSSGGSPWRAAQDPSSGKTYYYNKMTGETTWSPPPGMGGI